MVPQIIYIILQIVGLMFAFINYAKANNWQGLKWYLIGSISVYILLFWGGFFDPLIHYRP